MKYRVTVAVFVDFNVEAENQAAAVKPALAAAGDMVANSNGDLVDLSSEFIECLDRHEADDRLPPSADFEEMAGDEGEVARMNPV